MEKYIKDFASIIRDCFMENTYKMSWCRSLVEHSYNHPKQKEIQFDDLSRLIFKYYWDQSIFFYLEQGPNPRKIPTIHRLVKESISKYQKKHDQQPKFFNDVEKKVDIDVGKISTVLTHDVSWRFQIIDKKEYKIYDYKEGDKKLRLHRPDLIKEYSQILLELINYRWAQKLEDLNIGTPKIAKKVRGTDRENIKRGSLNKFKKYLDKENPNKICFISDVPIEPSDIVSIDHVIPWSFIFSDDLWNLVYVKKSKNSSKWKRIPDETLIKKLIDRNKRLLEILDNSDIKKDKHIEDLRLTNQNDGVRKKWNQYRG